MRTKYLLGFLLVAGAVAGCVKGDDGEGPAPTTSPQPPAPYTIFKCLDNSTVPAFAAGGGSRCNVRVTGSAPGNNGPANEVTIAVDPTNPLRLIAGGKDYTLGNDTNCGKYRVWAGYYWSDDGGLTWGNNLMPGHDLPASSQNDNALAGYHCTTDPVAWWDVNGNAWFSGLSYSQNKTTSGDLGSNVWVAKSTDGGATYADINLVAQGDGFTVFHDKQWFTFDHKDPNYAYFTWSMFVTPPTLPVVGAPPGGTDQIVFSRSTDAGQTWSAPRVLYETTRDTPSPAPSPELGKQFSMPVVDNDRAIHVIWFVEDPDKSGKIWYTRSTDQGATWSDAAPIIEDVRGIPDPPPPTAFRSATYPVLAVDRSNESTQGNLYIAYSAVGSGSRKSDIHVVRSTDSGNSWSQPVRANDDDAEADQIQPWVEVGPWGDVHLVFLDRRDDPDNMLLHTYYAHSKDGVAWDRNIRLSEVAANSTLSYHQGGFEFIGDYIGITEGTNGWVHPVWVDTRHGRADVYTTILAREP